jgi:hypothetical protein
MEGVDSKDRLSSVQCASGSTGNSTGRLQIQAATFQLIASGHIRVDLNCCQERAAVKCMACRQQLWLKGSGDSGMRLSFRKGQQSEGLCNGYLISVGIPKSKQSRQLVCLSCVGRLIGDVTESADGQQLLLSCRRDGREDAILLQRQGKDGHWIQHFELTNEVIAFVMAEDERTASRKRPRPAAAAQIGGRAAAKGVRPRARAHAMPVANAVSHVHAHECHLFF